MRFKEFSENKIDEVIPAVSSADLKKLGPAVLQATKNVIQKTIKTIDPEKTKNKPPQDPKAVAAQVAQAAQTSGNATPTPTTATATNTAPDKLPQLPAAGTQIVLPDKDTKKPSSFTVKNMSGSNVDLVPAKLKPNDPQVSVKVNKTDLEKAIALFRNQT
jgi:hypothetical protein